MPFKILIADNIPEFLHVRSEYLENAGYTVYSAGTPDEARRILCEEQVHLAILDIRLEDDDEDKDTSGLQLAQDIKFRAIPKIMLTNYPSAEYARDALKAVASGLPPAVDFLTKQQGPQVMLDAVAEALKTHLRLNPTLLIRWNPNQPISYAALVSALEPGLLSNMLSGRMQQLENLFQMLFAHYSQITVNRLLWSNAGRLALDVSTDAQQAEDQFILVCGQTALIHSDRSRCQECPPHLSTLNGNDVAEIRETVNYAGWMWSIAADGRAAKDVECLGEVFRTRPERMVRGALENLFEKTLLPWLRQGQKEEEEGYLGAYYRHLIHFSEEMLPENMLRQRLTGLGQLSLERGLPGVTFLNETLKIVFHGKAKQTFPDPLLYLYGEQVFAGPRVRLANSPGALDWDTILVSTRDRCWLSDFSHVGKTPIWDSFVSLEASLRFKYLDASNLQELYYFEKSLMNLSCLGESKPGDEIDPEYRKAANLIRWIRTQAADQAGDNLLFYLISLYYYTVQGLITFEARSRPSAREIEVLLYRVMLAAMLTEKIEQITIEPDTTIEKSATPRLRIDNDEQAAWLDGRLVHMSAKQFKLLAYLFEHAGELCKRDQIIAALHYGDPVDKTVQNMLDADVTRLREKIDPDAKNRNLLVTVRGLGFRINL